MTGWKRITLWVPVGLTLGGTRHGGQVIARVVEVNEGLVQVVCADDPDVAK